MEEVATELEDTARYLHSSLSPSRAMDFRRCALQYRFRTVDRLPQPPSAAAVRGTVVHRVLEQVFDLPARDRTRQEALGLVEDAWGELVGSWPEATSMFGPEQPFDLWLDTCRAVLSRYFDLEDPRAFEPAERELSVETLLASGLVLRGIVDRVDVASDGAMRIVDYKTGNAPPPGFEGGAMFQLRFYGLVLWRSRGVIPSELRLVYLGNGEVLTHRPDADELAATERLVDVLWQAIDLARQTGEFLPSPGSACTYCDFHAFCPVFGGTPPPYPRSARDASKAAQGLEVQPGQ